MSYILEALRRSQAERERGRVPGLDAQPSPVQPAGGVRRGPTTLWLGGGAVLLVTLGAMSAVWWARQPAIEPMPEEGAARSSRPVESGTKVAARDAAPLAPPAGQKASGVMPPTGNRPAPPRATLPQVVSAPAVQAAPHKSAQRASAPAVPSAAASSPPTAPLVAGVMPSPLVRVAPAGTSAPPLAAPAVVPIAQLNAEQRRDLPAMAIGGSIWSDNPANRFVIVNGQVVREGEVAAPGVTLERIAPKVATLRWRDLRVEVPL
jgi:general secretion pathway protein B